MSHIYLPLKKRKSGLKKNFRGAFCREVFCIFKIVEENANESFKNAKKVIQLIMNMKSFYTCTTEPRWSIMLRRKLTLFLLAQRYLMKEAFVRLNQLQLVAAF